MGTPTITGPPNERPCLLCGSLFNENNLTHEHVFPASIGGELVAKNATCSRCNGRCSTEFEATFLNSVKVLSNVLDIANRKGNVPNIDVSVAIDGRQFKAVLQSNGELIVRNHMERGNTEEGKPFTRYWLFDDGSYQRLREAASKRGERLVIEEQAGKDAEFEPQSFMPLDFLNSVEAKRMAAKVALTCIAAKLGQKFACSSAFDRVRCYVQQGTGDEAQLFFNSNFAEHTQAGPFQHLVIVWCDGQKHTAHAVVVFFGTMPYLVTLSSSYEGVDFGAQYAFDARDRKEVGVFVGHLENERLTLEDIICGTTRFGDVEAVANSGARVIQSAAAPRQISTVSQT